MNRKAYEEHMKWCDNLATAMEKEDGIERITSGTFIVLALGYAFAGLAFIAGMNWLLYGSVFGRM